MDARQTDGADTLVLEQQGGHSVLLTADHPVTLGCVSDNDLVVQRPHTSRCHARIECRSDGFVLVDHSTNGTFVQTEDERISYVHRGSMRLWGDGWLGLGEPCTAASAIRFFHP